MQCWQEGHLQEAAGPAFLSLLVSSPPPSPSQVSQSKEHQQFISFLQRLLGPLLEAYSSAAIFVHNFSGPVPESEYLQKLHRYLLTRTERDVAVYGMWSHCFGSLELLPYYINLLILGNWGQCRVMLTSFLRPAVVCHTN